MLLLFFVVSSRFLGGLGAVPRVLPLSTLKKRGKVGNSNGRRTHATRLDRAYLGKIALFRFI